MNLLLVKNAGHGETPLAPTAKFFPGDVVERRRLSYMARLPEKLVVLKAVPPGFPTAYALADLLGKPRPLMIQAPRRMVQYILCVEGDETPYCLTEGQILRKVGEVEIGTVSATPEYSS